MTLTAPVAVLSCLNQEHQVRAAKPSNALQQLDALLDRLVRSTKGNASVGPLRTAFETFASRAEELVSFRFSFALDAAEPAADEEHLRGSALAFLSSMTYADERLVERMLQADDDTLATAKKPLSLLAMKPHDELLDTVQRMRSGDRRGRPSVAQERGLVTFEYPQWEKLLRAAVKSFLQAAGALEQELHRVSGGQGQAEDVWRTMRGVKQHVFLCMLTHLRCRLDRSKDAQNGSFTLLSFAPLFSVQPFTVIEVKSSDGMNVVVKAEPSNQPSTRFHDRLERLLKWDIAPQMGCNLNELRDDNEAAAQGISAADGGSPSFSSPCASRAVLQRVDSLFDDITLCLNGKWKSTQESAQVVCKAYEAAMNSLTDSLPSKRHALHEARFDFFDAMIRANAPQLVDGAAVLTHDAVAAMDLSLLQNHAIRLLSRDVARLTKERDAKQKKAVPHNEGHNTGPVSGSALEALFFPKESFSSGSTADMDLAERLRIFQQRHSHNAAAARFRKVNSAKAVERLLAAQKSTAVDRMSSDEIVASLSRSAAPNPPSLSTASLASPPPAQKPKRHGSSPGFNAMMSAAIKAGTPTSARKQSATPLQEPAVAASPVQSQRERKQPSPTGRPPLAEAVPMTKVVPTASSKPKEVSPAVAAPRSPPSPPPSATRLSATCAETKTIDVPSQRTTHASMTDDQGAFTPMAAVAREEQPPSAAPVRPHAAQETAQSQKPSETPLTSTVIPHQSPSTSKTASSATTSVRGEQSLGSPPNHPTRSTLPPDASQLASPIRPEKSVTSNDNTVAAAAVSSHEEREMTKLKEQLDHQLSTDKGSNLPKNTTTASEKAVDSFTHHVPSITVSLLEGRYPFLSSQPCHGIFLEDLQLESDARFRAALHRLAMKRNNNGRGGHITRRTETSDYEKQKEIKQQETAVNGVVKAMAEELRSATLEAKRRFPFLDVRVEGVLLGELRPLLEQDDLFQSLMHVHSQVVRGASGAADGNKHRLAGVERCLCAEASRIVRDGLADRGLVDRDRAAASAAELMRVFKEEEEEERGRQAKPTASHEQSAPPQTTLSATSPLGETGSPRAVAPRGTSGVSPRHPLSQEKPIGTSDTAGSSEKAEQAYFASQYSSKLNMDAAGKDKREEAASGTKPYGDVTTKDMTDAAAPPPGPVTVSSSNRLRMTPRSSRSWSTEAPDADLTAGPVAAALRDDHYTDSRPHPTPLLHAVSHGDSLPTERQLASGEDTRSGRSAHSKEATEARTATPTDTSGRPPLSVRPPAGSRSQLSASQRTLQQRLSQRASPNNSPVEAFASTPPSGEKEVRELPSVSVPSAPSRASSGDSWRSATYSGGGGGGGVSSGLGRTEKKGKQESVLPAIAPVSASRPSSSSRPGALQPPSSLPSSSLLSLEKKKRKGEKRSSLVDAQAQPLSHKGSNSGNGSTQPRLPATLSPMPQDALPSSLPQHRAPASEPSRTPPPQRMTATIGGAPEEDSGVAVKPSTRISLSYSHFSPRTESPLPVASTSTASVPAATTATTKDSASGRHKASSVPASASKAPNTKDVSASRLGQASPRSSRDGNEMASTAKGPRSRCAALLQEQEELDTSNSLTSRERYLRSASLGRGSPLLNTLHPHDSQGTATVDMGAEAPSSGADATPSKKNSMAKSTETYRPSAPSVFAHTMPTRPTAMSVVVDTTAAAAKNSGAVSLSPFHPTRRTSGMAVAAAYGQQTSRSLRERPKLVFTPGASLNHIYLSACSALGMRPNSALIRTFPTLSGAVLEKVDLSVNYVGVKGLLPVLYVLEENSGNLRFLSLCNNNLENMEVLEVLEVLSGPAGDGLTHLDLSYNPISQTGGQALLRFVASRSNVTSIKLKGTLIPPKLMQTIVDKVEDNDYRKHIGLA